MRPNGTKRVRLVVSPGEAALTLEELLTGRGELTPETFQAALQAGGVTVNRRRAERPDARLSPRDQVLVSLVERGRLAGGAEPLSHERLLHLDASVVVVDKPAGVPAQGTLSDARCGLDEAVRGLLRAQGERDEVGLVHRLDLETTGVTVFGRNAGATSALARAFRDNAVRKTYVCLVLGVPGEASFVADSALGPHPHRRGLQVARDDGKPARTHFRVLERFDAGRVRASLLQATPETGRTHQIRVHAADAGHPLLGDARYGGPSFLTAENGSRLDFPRVFLHARAISLPHPVRGTLEAVAREPLDFSSVTDLLRALVAKSR